MHTNGSTPHDGEPTIDVLPDAEAAATAAATLIASALADAARQRGRADWATTGGSTPILLYRSLAQSPLRDLVPWDRVHVWWGDDRMVPRDHPLSNRLPFDEVLLPSVPIPEPNIHPIAIDFALGRFPDTDAAARAAAATYESELRAAPLARDPEGFPVLDVVLVGVGPDGHVFSVFPDSPLFDSPRWASAVPAPDHVEPHVARVSLHPRILVAARLPIVVVIGAGKASVVGDLLTGKRDVRRWPAQLARRPGAAWFLDEASAAGLRGHGAA
ncbi:MAG: 6-phosphogluconolactonase [Chloroflexi bacterium]|nr:6-phosphogluconolactonase [Chloroflexota bacterium]